MRLTEKIDKDHIMTHHYRDGKYRPTNFHTSIECYNKLGQLEDIEELCEKVVEKPIYEKFMDTHEIHKADYTECCALYSFKHNRIELYMYNFVNYLEIKDYGIWWALTKEELECDTD